jgi:hypothetical protein
MDCEDNCIDIQHDYYHSQDTREVLQEDDKMHPDPRLFSVYIVEIDITVLYPEESFRQILRHALKCARDTDSVTLHRISTISHVEYEIQRTICQR